ncbi:MAG: ABC transporter permease [Thermoplasmatales archaeon]|nr:ABC transporter permease [Thermoplasmatales archaeon]
MNDLNPFRRALKIIFLNGLSLAGFFIVIFFIFISIAYAILGNSMLPYNPYQINPYETNLPPSASHIFGTDNLGRDIFSRIIAALPIDIGISLLIVSISALIGLFLGIVAGYFRGIIEEIIMRTTDLFLAFPPLILPMAIAATLGPSLMNATISLIVVWWPPYVRLVRGNTLQVSAQDFITMSKVLNTPFLKILFRGILPNIITTLLVYATMDVGTAMLELSTLGFLGIGIPVTTPELGMMASILSTNFYVYPLEGLIPSIFIFLIVMGFSLLGEGLTEVIDPNIRSHLISRKKRIEEMVKMKKIPSA